MNISDNSVLLYTPKAFRRGIRYNAQYECQCVVDCSSNNIVGCEDAEETDGKGRLGVVWGG